MSSKYSHLQTCNSRLSISLEKRMESSALAVCEIRKALRGPKGMVRERPITLLLNWSCIWKKRFHINQ